MKKTARFAALLCLAQSTLHADVPLFINYQGKVADSTGLPIGASGTAAAPVAAPVNRKVIFRIYDASTGGNRLWTEEQTATISLGVFSVLLGNGIDATGTASTESRPALDTIFTPSAASSRFLEIMVDNGDNTITGSDVPISPRQQITSTAFALHAKVADGIASATDLTINPLTGTASNYGLGWYGAGRTFNSVAIDGPVLYGNSGGALGSAAGAAKNIALAWNAAGQVGVGATSSYDTNNKLTLQGDDSVTPARQLVIRGNADSAKRLNIGYNTTANQATLQSYTAASTFGNLLLNPSGGNVGIGTTSPSVALAVTGAITATGAITGGSFISNGGNVGIGTTAPVARFQLDDGMTSGTYGSAQISRPTNGHTGSHLAFVRTGVTAIGLGYAPSSNVFGFGGGTSGAFSPGALSIDTNNWNVGIGTAAPGFPLSMANTLGDKIALYGSSGAHYGLGVQNNQLQIHTDTSAGDVTFGYGSSAAMTETMRIKGNGNVGIGTASPASKLDVNGNATVRGWISLTGAIGMEEGMEIKGKSVAGTTQSCFWPRASNGTYLNYGTSGLFIRNNNSTVEMYFNEGRLGVGTTDTSQGAITTTTTGFTSTGTSWQNAATSYAKMSYRADRGGIAFDVFNSGQFPNVWRGFSYDGNSDIDWYSDRNLKKDIVDAEPMLDRLMQVPFRRFRWKDISDPAIKPEFGVIAQEVEPLFPDLVATGKDGMKTVGYTSFATITAKALQEYKTRNDADLSKLHAQIHEKDARIAALEAKLAEQEKRTAAQADADTAHDARLIALEKLINKSSAPETVSISLGEQ